MARDSEAVRKTATSVLDRIKSTARNRQTDPRRLIIRYAMERWLHRLTLSPYAGSFTLKGGMLMPLLGDSCRPTEDIDANTDAFMDEAAVREMVALVCATAPSGEDGLEFDASALKVLPIREGILPGSRATFSAWLRPSSGGATEIRMKLDLSHGDAITPSAVPRELPSAVRGFDPVVVMAYPWETVVAEKIQAVSRHGLANSRLKDYYDLLLLSRTLSFDGDSLAAAVAATFAAWSPGPVPEDLPGLSASFADARETDWKRYLRQDRDLKLTPGPLHEAVAEIRAFALPALRGAGGIPPGSWSPCEGWSPGPCPGFPAAAA